MADDSDIYADYAAGSDPAAAKAAALAAAIRGARASGAIWGGAPRLAGYGQGLEEAANAVKSDQAAVEQARQLAQAQDPNSLHSQFARQLAGNVGLQVPEGTPAAAYEGMLPEATRALQAEALRDYRGAMIDAKNRSLDQGDRKINQPHLAVNPTTGQTYNTKGGGGGPVPAAPSSPASPDGLEPWDKRLGKMQDSLRKDLDASGSSRNPFGANQAIINKAQGLSALMSSGQDLTPEQMSELATGVAALVSGGNSAAQSTIEHLTPPGVSKSVARLKEWLTSSPHGAGQQEFVQQFQHLVDRESQSAAQRILKTQLQRLGTHSDYASTFPNRMRQDLRSYGLDPGLVDQVRSGKYAPPQEGAGAGAGATGQTVHVKTVEEARALPKGTRFVDPNGVERVR